MAGRELRQLTRSRWMYDIIWPCIKWRNAVSRQSGRRFYGERERILVAKFIKSLIGRVIGRIYDLYCANADDKLLQYLLRHWHWLYQLLHWRCSLCKCDTLARRQSKAFSILLPLQPGQPASQSIAMLAFLLADCLCVCLAFYVSVYLSR